jgi:hypothetical protein
MAAMASQQAAQRTAQSRFQTPPPPTPLRTPTTDAPGQNSADGTQATQSRAATAANGANSAVEGADEATARLGAGTAPVPGVAAIRSTLTEVEDKRQKIGMYIPRPPMKRRPVSRRSLLAQAKAAEAIDTPKKATLGDIEME